MTTAVLRQRQHGPARCCLAVEAWPTADQRLWQAALRPGDIFEDGGPGANWAAATQAGVHRAYGRFLFWFDDVYSLQAHRDPAARVSPDVMAAYTAHLRSGHADTSVGTYLAFLACALRAMLPALDWTWVQRIARKVKARAQPVRDKQARLRDSSELSALGMELMAAADDSGADPTAEHAVAYRDGFAIALLAARPLRQRNFGSIEIGQHLIHDGGGWMLQFAGSETKNHDRFQCTVPAHLVAHLERYLSVFRPVLVRQTGHRDPAYPFHPSGDRLWVSLTGSAMIGRQMYKNICVRTRAKFGQAVYPHLFRDALATSAARLAPDQAARVTALLGHKSDQTVALYYDHSRGEQARDRLQRHVAAQRDQDGHTVVMPVD